jgi:hypothetical protein
MKVFIIALFAFPSVAIFVAPVHSSTGESDAFQLSNGVVVNLKKKEAYVMTPQGHVAALSIADGSSVWQSPQTAKPLALAGNVLLSQQASSKQTNQFSVLGLDIGKSGRQLFSKIVDLPPGVNASLERTPGSFFLTNAVASAQGAAVAWEYAELAHGGARPGGPESIVGTPAKSGSLAPIAPGTTGVEVSAITKGAFRVNFTSGKVTTLPSSEVPPPSHFDSTPTPGRSDASTSGSEQFKSADGRYTLTSRKIASDATWDKYLWSVFDESTHAAVGQLKSHLRISPFFVTDSKIVYEDGPYQRREASGEVVSAPRELRAVDLATGAVVWTQPLQDTNRPGSLPP